MKKTCFKISAFIFALFTIMACMKPMAQSTNSIFNGKNLDGWKIYGTEKWYVEDGLLICESGPDKGYGYLATDESYKDFEATMDFRQQANGNSGIFIRSFICSILWS